MTREEFYKSQMPWDSGYKSANFDSEVLVPVTEAGFEALLEKAADLFHLPIDDDLRCMLAGYIHHIPNEQCKISLTALCEAMLKSFSNTLTWKIDQDIKAKRREEEKKKLEEQNVTPIEQK